MRKNYPSRTFFAPAVSKTPAGDNRTSKWTVVTFSPLGPKSGGPGVRILSYLRFLEQKITDISVVLVGLKGANEDGKWRIFSSDRGPFLLNATIGVLKFYQQLTTCDTLLVNSPLFAGAAFVAKCRRATIVWDAKSCEFDFFRRKYVHHKSLNTLSRAVLWGAAETVMALLADVTICVSDYDKATFCKYFPVKRRSIYTLPLTTLSLNPSTLPQSCPKKFVLFLGTSLGQNNRDSLQSLLMQPQLLDRLYASDTFLVLAGLSTEKYNGLHPAVIGLGLVDNVRPLIEESIVCLAPLADAYGVSAKVIDYLKYGRRLIVTPEALTGINIEQGSTVLVSDRSAFGEQILACLMEPIDLRAAAEMNDIARKNYGETSFCESLESILKKASEKFANLKLAGIVS